MSMGKQQDPLSDGLVMESEMPLVWEQQGSIPVAVEKNERLLRVLLSSDEHQLERLDEEAMRAGELLRIEGKLDLVLELLAELLTASNATMKLRSTRLCAQGLEWIEPGLAPTIDSAVVVSFLPDPGLPLPLAFPARVLEVVPEAQGSHVRVQFEANGVAVVELLERLIFRHHRRQVAQMKQKK